VLPIPFASIGGQLGATDYIPALDSLNGSFGLRRKIGSFRANIDGAPTVPGETTMKRDSRVIGRSVWNTRWLLVIPAGDMLGDRDEAIDRFIDGRLVGDRRTGNGVSDIKIFFETYAASGTGT